MWRALRDSPLIVSREQDSTDQAGRGDADDLGDVLDLAIPSYQWIGRVYLGKLIKSSTSVSASSIRAASLGIGSDLIGEPGLRGTGFYGAFDCQVALLSGQSAVAVAARWLDRLKLLEVELGDVLQPVGQFRSFEVVRDVVGPGPMFAVQSDQRRHRSALRRGRGGRCCAGSGGGDVISGNAESDCQSRLSRFGMAWVGRSGLLFF
jgi:hypothetical protein